MRFKDLAVGKYVCLNRELRRYYGEYTSILKIEKIPETKEEKFVECSVITKYHYVIKEYCRPIIEVNYIHLLDISYDKESIDKIANCTLDVGDVLGRSNIGRIRFVPNVDLIQITQKTEGNMNMIYEYAVCGYKRKNVDTIKYACIPIINGQYCDKTPTLLYWTAQDFIWKGVYSSGYYSNKIRVIDNKLVVPKEIPIDSPCYKQIMKEAIECGIIKE